MFAGVNVLREALGATPRVDRWAGPNEVQSLFEPQAVHIAEHTLTTRAESLEAYLDEQMEHHRMWMEARQALSARGGSAR
ncbi:MAG: hypothetical protein M3P40_02960 [Actinomycetota bacterium]|nr:hypothetical protein [Actinomycetota bacterium]